VLSISVAALGLMLSVGSLLYIASIRRADVEGVYQIATELSKARANIDKAAIVTEKLRLEVDELLRINFSVHDYNQFCEDAVQRNPKFLCEIIPARPPLRAGTRAHEPALDPSTLPPT
jgi:hypothetical protein